MNPRADAMARRFQGPMLVASGLVVPVMIIENTPLPAPWPAIGRVLDTVIWLAFLAEMIAMLIVVDDRKRWLRHHPVEVIVVVLTPPILTAIFPGVAFLRVLRLLRLGPLARYVFTLDGVRYAALLLVLVVLAGGAAFDSVESQNGFMNGLYMAFNVVSTLGYGPQPNTDGGKLIAVVLVITGASFLALLTGSIAERFASRREEEVEEATERIEVTTEDLLQEIRALAQRMASLEAAVTERGAGPPPSG